MHRNNCECVLMASVECDGYILGECVNCPYFKEMRNGKGEQGDSVKDGQDL